MLRRAHAVFTLSAHEKQSRQDGEYAFIRGVATTPTPDRYGDTVEPLGAKFSTPLPLLWQHQSSAPVGNVDSAKPEADGIPIVARMPLFAASKNLRERIEEAYESVKLGLVRGLSVGFRGLPGGVDINQENWTFHFREWEWLELSLVTIPANAEATIQTVKAYDATLREPDYAAALGKALQNPVPVVRRTSDNNRRVGLVEQGVVFK